MTYDLSFLDDKDLILTGENRDMIATHSFLDKFAKPASIKHVKIDTNNDTLASEQIGNPNMDKTIVIKSPGLPPKFLDIPYITSAQIFFELANQIGAKIIGVTGTKGKTTTSALIHKILADAGLDARLCGNGGTSFLPSLEDADQNTIFVAELSSYMLNEITVSPNIAVVTNLYNDHVDWHETLEAYYGAKENIVKHQTDKDFYVYNSNFEMLSNWAQKYPTTDLDIATLSQKAYQTKLLGDHNQDNIRMCVAVAQLLDVPEDSYLKTIAEFEPVKHRLQLVRVVDKVSYIDDAIASMPDAAIAGIKAATNSVNPISVLLLGGQDRDYDFMELMQTAADYKIPNLVMFPDTIEKMKDALPNGYYPNIYETMDMIAAVKWASQKAGHNTTVLLSNGAPSYSLWKDFEDKGSQFQSAVMFL